MRLCLCVCAHEQVNDWLSKQAKTRGSSIFIVFYLSFLRTARAFHNRRKYTLTIPTSISFLFHFVFLSIFLSACILFRFTLMKIALRFNFNIFFFYSHQVVEFFSMRRFLITLSVDFSGCNRKRKCHARVRLSLCFVFVCFELESTYGSTYCWCNF